ncbi:MAG: hypothetical protein JWL72_95 [Ilumatobacteraceae bacterium]|nr:hypothetical protein [Ilumatobacteraceae bacterium]
MAVVSVAATRDGSVAATEPITVAYGADPSQFGQLWLPIVPKSSLLPVVVLIHGGFWREEYGLDLMDPLAKDLISRGDAVWNIEYRRVGQDGGGYPGTLDDVAAAIDALQGLAPTHHLDLADVVLVGHSAGGQLSLWAAGRATLPAGAPGADPKVTPRLAIGQGPVVDLVAGDAQGLGGGAVTDFIGGTAAQFPDRYAIASPNTSSGVPLAVVRGSADDIVPAAFTLPPDQAQAAQIAVVDIPGADHFALIDPASTAWQAVITLLD